jgi:tetratricopeptide (TPR) repeat protein
MMVQRKLAIAAALVIQPLALRAQSAIITLPDISQHARTSQRIGLTDITVDYHRPAVAGRRIFGALQPYGEVWRAGANYNTTFEVTDPVQIEGRPLGRGVYGLHMIPGASSWIVIFSRNSTSWGSFTYDSTEDALRVTVTPQMIPPEEVLTYDFDDPRASSVLLTMRWERTAVPLHITADVPHLVAASLRNQLRGRVQTEWQAWEEAANYLLENGLDTTEALQYATRSTQIEDRFENEITRARALTDLGRSAEAKSAQAKALSLGTQTQVYNFARTLQRLGQQQAAMEIFRSDVQRDPNSVYGHLEATRLAVAAHDFDKAIKECLAAEAVAPAGLKSSIEGLVAELRQGVDINR